MRPLPAARLVTALSLLCACGDPPEPCTECPDISGTFRMSVETVPATASSCKRLQLDGGSVEIEVTQDKSVVHVDPLDYTGTLYRDLALRFKSKQVNIQWVESGEWAASATETLGGKITIAEGRVTFTGTLTLVQDGTNCTLDAPVTWAPPL